MSHYILYTDHITLYQYGNAEVVGRLEATPEGDRAITIISVEEQLRGWFTAVHRAQGGRKAKPSLCGVIAGC